MDRLSALDAEFLHLEDGSVHMAIAGACVFADPPPTLDEVEALVASKMHLIPRYRQRVRTVPVRAGPARLGRRSRLRPRLPRAPHRAPGPRGRRRLLPAHGPAHVPGPRPRPPAVGGLAGGGPGRRAVGPGLQGPPLHGGRHRRRRAADRAARPRPRRPAGRARAVVAVTRAARGGQGPRRLGRAGRRPRRRGPVGARGRSPTPPGPLRSAASTATGTLRFTERLAPTRGLSIEGPIGPHRVWAHSSASLAAVKTVRNGVRGDGQRRRPRRRVRRLPGPAGRAGRRRRHGAGRARSCRCPPVTTTDEGVPDNRVSALFIDLPSTSDDPVDRLEAVRAQMAELKASGIAEAGQTLAVGERPGAPAASSAWSAAR